MKLVVCLSARGEELCRHFATGDFTFESLHLPRTQWHTKPRYFVVQELGAYDADA